ncbi:MAG TPA: di-heme oxidoredictase family protein [Vicinamibacterales bacterium]|nr:di-heme oxidoredictase family protein [Vicinamibacterales bacterium]
MRRSLFLVTALAFAGAIVAAQLRAPAPGEPLPGVTPHEFEEFRLGLDDFLEVETAEEGLGPAFNGTSCAACHNVPAIGGAGTIAEMRAGRRDATGRFQTFDATGETLFQVFSIPTHGCQAIVPPEANVFARRVPIPLFGAGLVEAIPDDTIAALEDPSDRDRDGVSGRAARIVDLATGERRIGRFGWKAQHATLLTFGADAYRNEMGITNDVFSAELAFGVSAERMRACDRIGDPEDVRDPVTRRRGIDNFASFMRFLGPVAREGSSELTRAGEQVFAAIGCATCHHPVLMTGPSSNPLFDRKPVALFSDLLLHDVGTGDGIVQGPAEEEEIRTPALWGLRLRRPLLHDGSAATAEDAVRRHAGEAELARRGFEQLSDADRAALLAFLRSI